MIKRLREVHVNLYRGGAPSIEDVHFLKKKFNVKKIVSLDAIAAKKIHRATTLLGIEHIVLPIDIAKRSTLLKFLRHNISDLLGHNGPTFVHCMEGKDRTGLAVALYRCEHDGWSPSDAIKEAKKLGFGIGVDPKVVALYEKLIRKSSNKNKQDTNDAYDIVSNERENPSDYNDYSQDIVGQLSWSPYEDYRVKEFPATSVDIDWPEQYDTRNTNKLNDSVVSKDKEIPQIGQYDSSSQGIMGAGPSMVGSGYV